MIKEVYDEVKDVFDAVKEARKDGEIDSKEAIAIIKDVLELVVNLVGVIL